MPTMKTRRIPIRGPDGKVRRYLTVPDRTDPAYRERTKALIAELDAILDQAAKESGLTRDELARVLSGEEELFGSS